MSSQSVRERIWALRDRASRRGKDDAEFRKWDAVGRDAATMTDRQLLERWPQEMLSVMSASDRDRLRRGKKQ